MELSLWANHPKDQPSLLLRSAFPKTDLYEGPRTPSVAIKLVVPGDSQLATLTPTSGTNRRLFWAVLVCSSGILPIEQWRAASLLPYPQTRKRILWEHSVIPYS